MVFVGSIQGQSAYICLVLIYYLQIETELYFIIIYMEQKIQSLENANLSSQKEMHAQLNGSSQNQPSSRRIAQMLAQLSPRIMAQIQTIPRCSSMTLIETPVPTLIKSSYMQQIDAGVKSISKIILWTNDDDQMNEDEAENQPSHDEQWSNDQLGAHSSSFEQIRPLFSVDPVQKSIEGTQKIPLLHSFLLRKQIIIKQSKQGSQQKKSCNCKKTQCLKLYCDCFRENRKCQGCSCVDCHNTQEHTQERKNAMLILTDRNPSAFKPKIQAQLNYHAKGCNCKKSGCQKKYCECFQAGLQCGTNCKCEECKNCEAKIKDSNKIKKTLPVNFVFKKSKGPSIIVPQREYAKNV